jgi:regulatory protein
MYNSNHTESKKRKKEITLDRVKNYLFWLIGRYGDYSTQTLKAKLNRVFSENTSFNEQALQYLIDNGYVDDKRYAERLIDNLLAKNIGLNKIKQTLFNKGLDSNLINDILSTKSQDEQSWIDKATAIKERKFGSQPITVQKTKEKALRFLINKGFSYAVSKKVIY